MKIPPSRLISTVVALALAGPCLGQSPQLLKGGSGMPYDTGGSKTVLGYGGSVSEFDATEGYAGAWGAAPVSVGALITGSSYTANLGDDRMIESLVDYMDHVGTPIGGEAAALKYIADRGIMAPVPGETNSSWGRLVSDPVDSVSGAFLVDKTDLTLAGPLPIHVRRNYNSDNGAFGVFGYGWKINTVPYLVVYDNGKSAEADKNKNNRIIMAAEMDGTVVEYVRDRAAASPVWRASNPRMDGSIPNNYLSNFTAKGMGSTSNLRAQRVELLKNASTRDPWIQPPPAPAADTRPQLNCYTIYGVDGSIRQYYEKSFPVGATVVRKRPYLYKWSDAQGNFLTFFYGTVANSADYGQLAKITSSNGAFIAFDYNSSGQIVSAYTNDGRRLYYDYDQFGDLVSVKRPDGAVYRYTYKHSTTDPAKPAVTVPTYSLHLITRVTQPEGRVLENDYDSLNRVVEQRATVGQGLALVRNATFVYTHPADVNAPKTGSTRIYDAFNSPSANPTTDTNCLIHEYTDGLITRITDPLGQAIQQEWYVSRKDYPDPAIDPAGRPGYVLPNKNLLPLDDDPAGYPRSLKRSRDKRGLVTHYWYDARGNVILQKQTGDFTGDGETVETRTVSSTYDDTKNLPLSVTTTVKNTGGLLSSQTKIVYDDSTDPDPAVPHFRYLPLSVERWVGTTLVSKTEMTYTSVLSGGKEARGLLKTKVDGLGGPNNEHASHTRMEYDARGFMTKQVRFATPALAATPTSTAGVADAESRYYYNYRGELVEETDRAGGKRRFDYDPMGRPTRLAAYKVAGTAETLLSESKTYYNLNGEVSWVDGPRSGPEDFVFFNYDADGRLTAEVRWRSRAKSDGTGVEAVPGQQDLSGQAVVQTKYDAFDNVVEKADANGNFTKLSYDAIGQLKRSEHYEAKTNLLLSVEEFSYEEGGKLSRSINAAGGITEYFYTTDGQLKRQVNPDGTVFEWRYTLDGRPEVELLPNGAKWIASYDDALRTVSRSYYAPPSTAAPDGALVGTETKVFDRRGNLVSATDLDGFASTTTYDALNRPLIVTGPVATTQSARQTSSFAYNLVTLTTTETNGLSQVSIQTTDVLGRPVRSEVKATANAATPISLMTYDYGTDHNRVTVTVGDPTTSEAYSRVSTFTDTFGQTVLTQLHRSATDYDVTRAVYDVAGNLIESIDARRQSTTLTYDGANRVRSTRLPDGAETRFAYDNLGNNTKRAMPAGLIWSAAYDTSGRIMSESLTGSDLSTSRKFSRTYYGSGAHVGLLKESRDLLRGVTSTISEYDAFRRPKAMSITGPMIVPASGALKELTQSYVYDKRGHLTEHLQHYPDGTIEDTKVIRQFDGYGQMTREQVLVDNVVHSTVDQHWNEAGSRRRLDGDMSATPVERFTYAQRADGLLESVTEKMTGQNHVFQFNYDRAGQLTSRVNPWRTQTVLTRDLQGRILTTATKITGQSSPFLSETLGWREDGRLNTYATVRSGAGSWDEAQAYTYDVRGHLVNETYSPAAGQSASIAYSYDQSGLGVRTSSSPSTSAGARWQVASGGLDGWARIIQESTGTPGATPAYGYATGAGSVRLNLKKLPSGTLLPVDGLQFNPDSQDGRWDVALDLPPGDYELQARAVRRDESVVSSPAISRFQVAANTVPRIHTTYDEAGYARVRTWSSGSIQLLEWDVLGRLVGCFESNGSHYRLWKANYDGSGRRIAGGTQWINFSGGMVTNSAVIEKSLYDPQVEFLEMAAQFQVSGATNTFWKVYGPDLNGAYGGLQGTGGLEATIRQSNQSVTALVGDAAGHAIASISGTPGSTTVAWSATQVSGYGALPGQVSKFMGLSGMTGATLELATATVWRGHRIDPTGLYYLGARYYEPLSGRFLSPDPAGHAASMSLYDYAYGDPINYMDPDGRLGKKSDNGTITKADYQELAGALGWSGFTDNLSDHQQNYYGKTALDIIRLEQQGRDMSGAWKTVYNEVPGVMPNWEHTRGSLILIAGLTEMLSKSAGAVSVSGAMLNTMSNLARSTNNIHIVGSRDSRGTTLDNRGFISIGGGKQGGTADASPRQTMATGKEWFDHFSGKYGAQNVEWTSGSGRTFAWPSQLPRPAASEMLRVRPPERSSTFVSELKSTAGPRPVGSIAHHTQPLGLNGADSGLINGSWVPRATHDAGHGVLTPQVNSVPYGTWIIFNK